MRALDDELLLDPTFRQLLTLYSRRALTWETFLTEALPPGMSAAATWALLYDLGRDMGLSVPIPDLDGNQYWYRRPYQLTDDVHAVACACREGSALPRIVTAAESRHFLLGIRAAELVATAALDGFEISAADVKHVVLGRRKPATAVERMAYNAFVAWDGLEKCVDEPFSPALFRRFAAQLAEGIERDQLSPTGARLGIIAFDYDDERLIGTEERQMHYIADYANHVTGDPYDSPVSRALLLPDLFRLYRPIGHMSTQVGRMVAHLYALKHGLPALGLLPISQARLDLEMGSIAPPAVSMTVDELRAILDRAPGDLTPYSTITSELAVIALRAVQQEAAEWERRDKQIREILRREPLLNQRQRSILHRALRSPDAEFNIRYHQRNHRIAYTTARRDLLELAEKGFLEQRLRGKTFVFAPATSLSRLLGGGHPLE